MAKCRACENQFSVCHGGENDIQKHMKTEKHKRNIQKLANTNTLEKMFNKTADEVKKMQIAECSFIYHSVQHSHSYLSVDCTSKLFSKIFPDSKIAENLTCGRTKATKIVTNILGPYSKKIILENLSKHHPFSLSTDASNKGHIKTFPMMLRYFDKQEGTKTKLLKFYSSNSEKSHDIAQCLVRSLEEANLSVKDVTAYGADNASVNFGKKQSVFVELQKLNEDIIPVGCVCHIIHNTGKNGQRALRYV